MNRPLVIFVLVCGGIVHAQAPQPARTGAASPAVSASPATNWVLPLFTDREGYRSMTLRGSEIRPAADGSIGVTDLSITVFSEDAQARVDSVLLSSHATFLPKANRAAGDGAVRLIRDDLEVNGTGWTYDHAGKKVSIRRNVRVAFKAQLNDILK